MPTLTDELLGLHRVVRHVHTFVAQRLGGPRHLRDRCDRSELLAPLHVIGWKPQDETHAILPARGCALGSG